MIDSIPDSMPAAPPRRRKQNLWRLPLYILFLYVAWCACLYFFQDRLLFRPDLISPLPPGGLPAALGWDEHGPAALRSGGRPERITLEIDTGGKVEAWFLPAGQASAERPAPVVVFFHGNAELADHQSWFVRQYHRMGISLLLPEYRGYGQAAGSPSEAGIVADAVRFHDAMRARPDVDPRRIVFHGRSLGGGVAAQVAARREPAALILECTFTSVAIMAHNYWIPTSLARHPFRTDEVLSKLDIPVLIVHGLQDQVVSVEHGRRLRDLARRPTYVEYPCGHNDLPPPGLEVDYWRRIAAFLAGAGIFPGD